MQWRKRYGVPFPAGQYTVRVAAHAQDWECGDGWLQLGHVHLSRDARDSEAEDDSREAEDSDVMMWEVHAALDFWVAVDVLEDLDAGGGTWYLRRVIAAVAPALPPGFAAGVTTVCCCCDDRKDVAPVPREDTVCDTSWCVSRNSGGRTDVYEATLDTYAVAGALFDALERLGGAGGRA